VSPGRSARPPTLARAVSEREAGERLRHLATVLFGADAVVVVPVRDGEPPVPGGGEAGEPLPSWAEARARQALAAPEPVVRHHDGFTVTIGHGGETVAVLVVRGLAFPQHTDRYLELVPAISGAFGLALAHAREFDRIQAEARRIEKLLEASAGLEGLDTICAGCKKIKEAEGKWRDVELVLLERAGHTFSHGLCPDCARRYFGTASDTRRGWMAAAALTM